MADRPDKLKIAGREFTSRLMVGTGKFASNSLMAAALEASGAEIVTVALRRADLSGCHDPYADILDFIDPAKYLLLPNTSGAMDASEAIRLARLAAAAGLPRWIKLEIHPDPRYLLPDPIETLKATEVLAAEGFTVLPYINADPVLAKRLEDAGAATVMPLGSPIGSNRGMQTRAQIEIIIEQARIPVVVDAGIGVPSHAAEAMEIGACQYRHCDCRRSRPHGPRLPQSRRSRPRSLGDWPACPRYHRLPHQPAYRVPRLMNYPFFSSF